MTFKWIVPAMVIVSGMVLSFAMAQPPAPPVPAPAPTAPQPTPPKLANDAGPGFVIGAGPNAAQPAANLAAYPYITPQRIPNEAESKLMREFFKLENQSAESAKKYRKGQETLGEKHPDQQKLREQVEKLVGEAFDVRQELQNEELKQLKERVAKVEESLSKRLQNRGGIVGKRTKELLEEDRELEWNSTAAATARPYTAEPGTIVPRTIVRPDGRPATVYELPSGPIPAPVAVPAIPAPAAAPLAPGNIPGVQPVLPPLAAAVPFPPATGSPADNSFTFPAGASQRRAYTDAAAELQAVETEVADLKAKFGAESVGQNGQYQNAVRRLQTLKRQFEAVQREFDAQRTLLQLDFQAVKAEFDAAESDYQRMLQLKKSNTISEEELRRSRNAQQQAEYRVSRAKVLLELHEQAMKSVNASSP